MPKQKNDADFGDLRPVGEQDEEALAWLFYGRSSTGKTTLAGSFPQPHLYLDIGDEGTMSIKDMGDIQVRDIESLEDLEDIYWALKSDPKRFATVTIDTITRLRQLAIEYVAKKKKRKGNAGEWGTLTKQDYGDVAAYMKEWLKNFRDLKKLGIEVVFLAQERASRGEEEESEDDQIMPEVGPDVGASVMRALNAMVDVIGNTFIRSRSVRQKAKGGGNIKVRVSDYCLRIGPNPVYITKLRKPKDVEVPDVLVDPDYDFVVDTIEGVK